MILSKLPLKTRNSKLLFISYYRTFALSFFSALLVPTLIWAQKSSDRIDFSPKIDDEVPVWLELYLPNVKFKQVDLPNLASEVEDTEQTSDSGQDSESSSNSTNTDRNSLLEKWKQLFWVGIEFSPETKRSLITILIILLIMAVVIIRRSRRNKLF